MRWFLHLRQADGTLIHDEEGHVFSTSDAARTEALDGLREFAAVALKHNKAVRVVAVEIHDERGRVEVIDMADALPPAWHVPFQEI